MDIERMEIVGINVKDVRKAQALFAELLGVEFREFELGVDVPMVSRGGEVADPSRLSAGATRVAIDTSGFIELIQTTPAAETEGFRNIHFKVRDMDAAMAKMRSMGIRMVADLTVGSLREVIYDPEQLYGIRLCLVEYAEDTLIDAVLTAPGRNGRS